VPVTIREFLADDFDELWRIDQDCFAAGVSYTRAELEHYIKSPGAFTLIATGALAAARAEQAAPIDGFIIAQKSARANGHIITIDVREQARRAGVGSVLMRAAEDRLRAGGCRVILLEVAVDNPKALAFYKRHGFNTLKTIPRYYQDSVDALLMGKRLE
jgi:[ribosomal protein S18]-alanine N-acetyltransferase